MKECSLYKRTLQEGIITKTFHEFSYYKDDKEVTGYLCDVSGLTDSDKMIASMKPIPCIEMKEITDAFFDQRKKELLSKDRDSRGIPILVENVMSEKEIVMPFDSFFIEIGKETRDDSPYKGWSFAAIINKADEDNGVYLMGFSLIAFLDNARPCLVSINSFNWNKDTRIAVLLTAKNLSAPVFGLTSRGLDLQIVSALGSVCAALNWLTAKNVKLSASKWTPKEQKWSKRATGETIDKHYTLVVEIPSKQRSGGNGTGLPVTKALHLVRGHLAHYTEDKPLFGRLVGTFYIPAHTRGNKEKGTIKKEYSFKVNL